MGDAGGAQAAAVQVLGEESYRLLSPTQHQAAGPEKAIQLLQPTRRYEAATSFRPMWMRGQAHLEAKNGALAASEFQKIIEHRGWDALSPLWPLASLGLARAAALQGDVAKSRQAYENFFRLWKEADPELPVLIEAKRERERLK